MCLYTHENYRVADSWRRRRQNRRTFRSKVGLSTSAACQELQNYKKINFLAQLLSEIGFFWLKANKLRLLEGLFGHSSVFSGISFKIFNKKKSSVLLQIIRTFGFRLQDIQNFLPPCEK